MRLHELAQLCLELPPRQDRMPDRPSVRPNWSRSSPTYDVQEFVHHTVGVCQLEKIHSDSSDELRVGLRQLR
eukprot:7596311-Pyramimonas_sp.AAC.1